MTLLPFAVLLLVAAAPVKEKKPALKAARMISVAQVMSETAARGNDWTLDESRATTLGMDANTNGKKLILDGNTDTTQHAVIVILDSEGKITPELLVSSTTAVAFTDGQPSAIDGYTFRADKSGKLISGLRAHGKVEEIEHVKLEPSSVDTTKRFEAIMKTVRNHAGLRGTKK